MPVRHSFSFDEAKYKSKCEANYYVRLQIPTCSLGEKPFIPSLPRGSTANLSTQVLERLTTHLEEPMKPNRPPSSITPSTNAHPIFNPMENIETQIKEALEPQPNDDIYTNVFKSHVKKRLSDGISEKGYGKMSASEIEAARMTKVSYINLTEGRLAALAYTKEHLPSYELITKDGILTEHGALFKNKNTNELRLAYRGTQTGVDWKTNFRLASMLEEGGMQIKELEEQMANIEKSYGRKPDLITGHSKGGGQAIYMGEKHRINTITQDPFVPTRHWFGGKTNAQHTVIRTPTDVVSSVSNISKFRQGFTQVDIQATAGESVLQSHDLNVMTGVEYKGKGSTVYNPKLKDLAFLAQHLQEGHSKESIMEKFGLTEGSEDFKLTSRYFDNILQHPETHQLMISEAGFQMKTPNPLIGKAKSAVQAGTGKFLKGVTSTVNAGSVGGLVGAIGVTAGLQALGVNDEATLATTAGAVGDVATDVTAGAVKRLAEGTTATTAAQAVRNITADAVEGTATRVATRQARSAVARTASVQSIRTAMTDMAQTSATESGAIFREASKLGQSVRSGISPAALLGNARFMRAFARGGASGLLTYATTELAREAFKNVGVNDDVADVLAGIYGGAVGGSVYGPIGAAAGAILGGVIEGVDNATDDNEPAEPEYTADEVQQISFSAAQQQLQQDETFGFGDDGQTFANLASTSDDNGVNAQILSGLVGQNRTSRQQALNNLAGSTSNFFATMNQVSSQLSHNQNQHQSHHSSTPPPTHPAYQSNRFNLMM